LLVLPLVGLIASAIGLFQGKDKPLALAGLIISGLVFSAPRLIPLVLNCF
jgi:hypothetical protein